jgi:hypothetical protein
VKAESSTNTVIAPHHDRQLCAATYNAKTPREYPTGLRCVLPDRLINAAKGVQVVVMISLAVGSIVKALSLASETMSARTPGDAILYARDKSPRVCASSTAEISNDRFVNVINADCASVSPKPIGTLAALGNLATDRDEFFSVSMRIVTAFEAFAGDTLDSIKTRHVILPTTTRGHDSITAI